MKLLILPDELVGIRPPCSPCLVVYAPLKAANGCMVKIIDLSPLTCLKERSTLREIVDADDGVV